MKIISRFRGKYKFLSNFSESPFVFESIEYQTVEHAYQERKTHDMNRRLLIRTAQSPVQAAKLGRSNQTILRSDWCDIKGKIMAELVYEKFKQNSELSKKLIETDNAILIEGNYWHDNYFGICSCNKCHEGEQPLNILGEILMDVRNKIRQDPK